MTVPTVGPHGYDVVSVADRAARRRWLDRNHTRAKGVWVVRPRRRAERGIDYDALVEEALCFGWIDSREQPLDDEAHRRDGSTRREEREGGAVNELELPTEASHLRARRQTSVCSGRERRRADR